MTNRLRKYAVVSIQPSIDPASFDDFSTLYRAVGANTGNLVFTNAVWRGIAGEKL